MTIIQLNLQDDASIPEIYRCIMEQTIQNSQVEIPSATLKDYHLKLIDDLYKNNLVDKNNESDKILANFETAKVENERLGERNLTFRTKFSDSERYSEFYDEPNAESTITIIGDDPTAKFLTTAAEKFGYDYCAGVQGSQTALSEEAGTSSLTFDKMLDKGILTSTIEATSYVKHDIPEGGYCYAREALLSLHLYTPYDVDIDNDCLTFDFSKTSYSYGDDRTVNLTTLKLLPQSTVNASARANYEVSIEKGCRAAAGDVDGYERGTLGEEKNMKDTSSILYINFKNISIANFQLENKFESSSIKRIVVKSLLGVVALWISFGQFRENVSLEKDKEASISQIKLSIATRSDGFKCVEDSLIKVALEKRGMIDTPLGNNRDTNVKCGHTFEGVTCAKVLAVAAKQRIPLTFVKGDGIGTYLNNKEVVPSAMFVDAIFINNDTAEKYEVQFKFSRDEVYATKSFEKYEEKWEKKGANLSNIHYVVPKDVNKSGNFESQIKFGTIIVNTPTCQEIISFLDIHSAKLKLIAKLWPELKEAKKDEKNLKKKVKGLEVTIKRKKKILDKNPNTIRLKEEIEILRKDCNKTKELHKKSINKIERINSKIYRIIREGGQIPIPGMDDEVPKQEAAKTLLKEENEEKVKIKKGKEFFLVIAAYSMCYVLDSILHLTNISYRSDSNEMKNIHEKFINRLEEINNETSIEIHREETKHESILDLCMDFIYELQKVE